MNFTYKEFRKLEIVKPIVYLVASHNNEHLKIGTASHPKDRIGQIQTCQPGPITIVSYIESTEYILIEKALHKEFKKYNTYGEWFTNEKIIVDRFIGLKANTENIT